MKKTILMTLFAALALSVSAQRLNHTEQADAEAWKLRSDFRDCLFIGADDQHVFLAHQFKKKLLGSDYGRRVVRYNRQLVPQDTLTLDGGNEGTGGFLADGRVYMVEFSDPDKGNELALFRQAYDAATFQPVGQREKVSSLTKVESAVSDVRFRTSRSGGLHGAIFLAYSPTAGLAAYAALYDNSMEELWGMRLDDVSDLDDFIVTDSGTLCLCGCTTKEGVSRFEFHILDGENDEKYTFEDSGHDLEKMSLCGVADGKFLLTGFANGRHDVAGMVYDTKSDRAALDIRPIPTEEMCLYGNFRLLKQAQGSALNEWVSRCCFDYDETGASAGYHVPVRVTGDVNLYEEFGLLAVRVGADGKVKWIKGLQRSTAAAPRETDLLFNRIFCRGGKTFVVLPERKDFLDANRKYKQVKVHRLASSQEAVIVAEIDEAGGKTFSSFLLPKGRYLVGGPHQAGPDRYLQFLLGRKGGGFLEWSLTD